ncbi:MAG: CHAT domain-containing protein [Gammaproteobacteria bacterium]
MRWSLIASLSVTCILTACAPDEPTTDDLTRSVTISVRGHQEVRLQTGQPTLPWFIGAPFVAGVCLSPPLDADTTQWRLAIDLDQHDPNPTFKMPTARRGEMLCVDTQHTATDNGLHALCATVVDDFDGAIRTLPCEPVHVSTHDSAYAEASDALQRLLRETQRTGIAAEFLTLAAQAHAQQRPATALRALLIAAHFERRDGGHAAANQLDTTPSWLDDNAAHAIAAQFFYERSMIALLQGNLRAAWQDAVTAERRFRAVAHPKTIVAATRRAQVLQVAGAADEARRDLTRAIAQCGGSECELALLRNARSTLAWWLMRDGATPADLEQARTLLTNALDATKGLERANALLNQAWMDARSAHVSSALDEAGHLLRDAKGQRGEQLRHWHTFLLARNASHDGDPVRALQLLDQIRDTTPELATRTHSMRGHLLRASGRRQEAAQEFSRAVALHRRGLNHDMRIPLSPGQRASDHYALALNAIDLDAPEAAWTALSLLGDTPRDSSCDRDRNHSTEQRLDTLYQELNTLQGSVSTQRARQRAQIRTQLMLEQRALLRSHTLCHSDRALAAEPDLRAFFYDNTIVVLARDDAGRIAVAKRTPIKHASMHSTIDWMRHAQNDASIDDIQWRMATRDLALALLPPPARFEAPLTRMALHGALQNIPVGALPYGDGWLADLTTLVQTPAGQGQPFQRDLQRTRGAVVIDPSENFASAQDSHDFFSRELPSASIIRGSTANVARVLRAAREARWLHIDAHGAADQQFADLYALHMADGLLFSAALTRQAGGLEFANLSSCRSAAFPLTADGGQWGLAGALAQAGVPWVIAARHDLDDEAAARFNQNFYAHYNVKPSVPAAYRHAHAALREAFPARIWSALILVGGQTDATRTPPLIAQPVSPARRAPATTAQRDE